MEEPDQGSPGQRFGRSLRLRASRDFQRIQKNGDTPLSRDGRTVEDNRRTTQGYSTFFQNRFFFGNLTLTPGLRIEHVRYDRTNRLFNGGAGAFGKTDLTQLIPGIGPAAGGVARKL